MENLNSASQAERAILQQAGDKRVPINGSIELLPLCNMKCDMCYVRLSHEEMKKKGRMRTADEWISLAKEMRDAGVLFLLLTGGEPLIYPDFKRLYLALREMGFLITINTNGTLIDEDWAAFFGKHKPRRVNITLYGADEQAYTSLCHYPGGFEKTLQGIRLLHENGISVKVGNSLTRQNYEERNRIPLLAQSLNVVSHTDTYMFPAIRERKKPFSEQTRVTPEEAAKARLEMLLAERSLEKGRMAIFGMMQAVACTQPGEDRPGTMQCMAGRCSFTVNWQGEMRPCVMVSNPSVPVFDVGFETAWKRIVGEIGKIRLSSTCSQCRLRRICDVCAASALLETGRYDGVPEYMCRYTKETYRLLAAFCARAAREKGEES